jgi:hypothetical protein
MKSNEYCKRDVKKQIYRLDRNRWAWKIKVLQDKNHHDKMKKLNFFRGWAFLLRRHGIKF